MTSHRKRRTTIIELKKWWRRNFTISGYNDEGHRVNIHNVAKEEVVDMGAYYEIEAQECAFHLYKKDEVPPEINGQKYKL